MVMVSGKRYFASMPASCGGPWERAAHLFAVSGFAVAQPLYAVLAKHVDFFVAHDAQPQDILLLACLLSIGVPAFLTVLEWAAGYLRDSIGNLMHLALLSVLAALAFLPLLKKIPMIPDAGMVAGAVLAGLAAACAYATLGTVRTLVTFVAVASLLFPLSFMFFSPVREMVFDGEDAEAPGPAATAAAAGDTRPPVFFIIFEETPLASLLDENRLVDAIRYPNFARLSREAHWFRNFTVNATATKRSVATMLTGRYVKGKAGPLIAEKHPESMFTLLGPGYRFVTSGISKRMCPKKYLRRRSRKTAPARRPPARRPPVQSGAQRLGYVIQDVFVIYSRVVLPPGFADNVPVVTDSWAHFVAPDAVEKKSGRGRLSKLTQLDHFIEYIAARQEPTLYYLHSKLVHNAWQVLPSGKQYLGVLPGCETENQKWGAEFGFGGRRWSDNEWLVVQGYQRHLLEVGAADAELGKLIEHLERLDVYDRSLVVVVSDHGCSFEPGERIRGRIGTVEQDTMPVPLFMKLPFQREGVISDQNVEAIDVLPTVADVLGVEVPWPVDGHSAFSTAVPRRAEKTLFFSDGEYRVAADNQAKYVSLARKLEIFGSGRTKPDGYFSIGPYGRLVGARTAALRQIGSSDLAITLDRGELFDQVDMDSPFCSVCYVSGEIAASAPLESPVHLAISVNGAIRAVTQTYREPGDDVTRFYAIVPEDAFRDGRNAIGLFAIAGEGGQIQLSRITAQGG